MAQHGEEDAGLLIKGIVQKLFFHRLRRRHANHIDDEALPHEATTPHEPTVKEVASQHGHEESPFLKTSDSGLCDNSEHNQIIGGEDEFHLEQLHDQAVPA